MEELPALSLHCALELAMGGIRMYHVDHVDELNECVIYVTIPTLPELKAALVTRRPIWPNPFTLTFTIVSRHGWQCTRRCGCPSNREERSREPECCFIRIKS
jgi:hypothetical protein